MITSEWTLKNTRKICAVRTALSMLLMDLDLAGMGITRLSISGNFWLSMWDKSENPSPWRIVISLPSWRAVSWYLRLQQCSPRYEQWRASTGMRFLKWVSSIMFWLLYHIWLIMNSFVTRRSLGIHTHLHVTTSELFKYLNHTYWIFSQI